MKLKVNQIIKNKDGREAKVLEVLTNTVLLSDAFDQEKSACWYTVKELIENEYIITKEEWEPLFGETYWFIDSYVTNCGTWLNDLVDNGRKNFLGIYKSKEDAEKALEEIKKKLGK